jgi:hypothetical protein
VKEGNVVLVRRDDASKATVARGDLVSLIKNKLEDIHNDMFAR